MLIAGLDLETTGLKIGDDVILELGLVLWSTELQKPLMIESLLFKDNNDKITEEGRAVNGISPLEVLQFGGTYADNWERAKNLLKHSMCIVAHNGNAFDKPFLLADFEKHDLDTLPFQKPWIDTTTDIDYPANWRGRNLTYLAAEHGFLNPFPHRAIFDVLTMLKILSKYDIEQVLALSQEPKIMVQAICLPPWEDGGKSTGIAKENGFRWNGSGKRWEKSLRRNQYQSESKKLESMGLRLMEVAQ